MIGQHGTWVAGVGLAALMTVSGTCAGRPNLKVQIGGLDRFGRLPDRTAFCPPTPGGAKNVSPTIQWSAGPRRTRSYALLMIDPDVPKDLSQINKPGTTIATDAARITVYHWVLDDIPANITSLAEGVESEGLVPHGKPVGETRHGRRGVNIFTNFFAANPELVGVYGGYDGPCPPTNDQRPHRYIVRVFALDVLSLGLSGTFDGASVEKAMHGHVLAQGEATAIYQLNSPKSGRPPL
jgi:Raf kinase inhibitor-like YbhB/YbcL family protein